MIREVLAKNNASDWYKSFSFMEGCASHLQHLKNVAEQSGEEQEEDPDFNNIDTTTILAYENSHHFNP